MPTLIGMAAPTLTTTAWVVRDMRGRVVVVFWGTDAEDEAREWSARPGYRVDATAVSYDS